jgi:glutamate racemase
MHTASPGDPIGIFDSGVGGLSVLRAIRQLMPDESTLYFGDQVHVPYGPRTLEEVRAFSEAITRFLERSSKIIVVACNSASAAALEFLRGRFPEVDIVGMEPAVKPAAETTSTGMVGVLATPATFQGALYASVVERFAAGVEILRSTCPGLVELIERGELNGSETRSILDGALLPMLARGIDTVVLACTHYPFVIPLIEQIVGPDVRVVDPAPAIARQTRRLLEKRDLVSSHANQRRSEFHTSAQPGAMTRLLPLLLGEEAVARKATWIQEDRILAVKAASRVGAGFESDGIA